MTDYRFVCDYGGISSYDGERHVNRYNWKFTTDGALTHTSGVRITPWQLLLAVL